MVREFSISEKATGALVSYMTGPGLKDTSMLQETINAPMKCIQVICFVDLVFGKSQITDTTVTEFGSMLTIAGISLSRFAGVTIGHEWSIFERAFKNRLLTNNQINIFLIANLLPSLSSI